MQDQIIASHTCFGGHMDVNCLGSLHTLNVSDDLKMDYKHTCDTIYTDFWGITGNIYGFGRPFYTRPPIFLHIHNGFYPSKWRVDRSLHKAMLRSVLVIWTPGQGLQR